MALPARAPTTLVGFAYKALHNTGLHIKPHELVKKVIYAEFAYICVLYMQNVRRRGAAAAAMGSPRHGRQGRGRVECGRVWRSAPTWVGRLTTQFLTIANFFKP